MFVLPVKPWYKRCKLRLHRILLFVKYHLLLFLTVFGLPPFRFHSIAFSFRENRFPFLNKSFYLEITREARAPLLCSSSNSYTLFVLSELPAWIITRQYKIQHAMRKLLLRGNKYILNWNFTFVASVIWCKTSFTFLCSKDVLRITDATGKSLNYCGKKTGQNLLVTGRKVEMTFRSDDNIERRGYYLVFTLVSLPSVSPSSALPHGKWDHKEAD